MKRNQPCSRYKKHSPEPIEKLGGVRSGALKGDTASRQEKDLVECVQETRGRLMERTNDYSSSSGDFSERPYYRHGTVTVQARGRLVAEQNARFHQQLEQFL